MKREAHSGIRKRSKKGAKSGCYRGSLLIYEERRGLVDGTKREVTKLRKL